MAADFNYSWRLFKTLTWTNFKMRYYGSILGYIWSLLKPLALFGVLYIVFTVVMKQKAAHYGLFLLLGIILWEFFVQGSTAGMNSFIGNYQMIRKLYFPRIILVAAAVSSAFLGLFFNLLVFLVFALFDGISWSPRMLWFFPLLVTFYFLVLGIGLILSIVVVKVRDMLSLWEVMTQLGFWFTPVMYPMSNVPEKYRFYEFLNPMSGILEYSRYLLIGLGSLTKSGYGYVMAAGIVVLFAGITVFKWKEAEMVEDL